MRLAVILPHTKLYGGVKRFFELGNVLLARGHEFIVFTPEGHAPVWHSGNVITKNLSEAQKEVFDAVFITETQFLPQLSALNSRRKILYFVRPTDNLRILKKYPDVEVFANSTNGYEVAKSKFKIEAFKAFGGINTKTYSPKILAPKKINDPIVILTYGRLVEKRKGTRLIVKACERLFKKGYPVRLLLFDTPVSEKAEKEIQKFSTKVPFEFVINHPVDKNAELFHRGDIFVAAEKKSGYANTAVEAMACGLPVIATTSGTKDFLIHKETGIVVSRWSWRIAAAIEMLINDFDLRFKLSQAGRKKVEEFSWESLAERIITYLQKRPEYGNKH